MYKPYWFAWVVIFMKHILSVMTSYSNVALRKLAHAIINRDFLSFKNLNLLAEKF